MMRLWLGFRSRMRLMNESGASAVEYGILIALIAAVILGVVGLIGTKLIGAYQSGIWP